MYSLIHSLTRDSSTTSQLTNFQYKSAVIGQANQTDIEHKTNLHAKKTKQKTT